MGTFFSIMSSVNFSSFSFCFLPKAGQAGKMSEPTKRKGRRASIVQSSSGQFPTTADIDKIFGNVKSLLMLLTKSSDTDAQRFAAMTLGNAGSAPFNRTRIATEGAVQVLVDFMKDEDNDIDDGME